MTTPTLPHLPPPPPVAAEVFGPRLDQAVRYLEMLAGPGVVRGLVGPREVPRLWHRHLVNCALIAELFAPGEAVVDVGSGAGLPGVVLALIRPDLQVTLVESQARRTAFLDECRSALGLGNVSVYRGRAEHPDTVTAVGGADVVTSRAVAPLDRLAAWCLPLARPGGRMLAVKGASAQEEVRTHAGTLARLGGTGVRLRHCGVGMVQHPTAVVVVCRGDRPGQRRDR